MKHQEKPTKTTVLDYKRLEWWDTLAISGYKCETSGKNIKTNVLDYNMLESRDTIAISGHKSETSNKKPSKQI